MAKEKPNMNVVFVGHVDAGKSTIVGRLMFESGIVSEQEMKKLREEAQKYGEREEVAPPPVEISRSFDGPPGFSGSLPGSPGLSGEPGAPPSFGDGGNRFGRTSRRRDYVDVMGGGVLSVSSDSPVSAPLPQPVGVFDPTANNQN